MYKGALLPDLGLVGCIWLCVFPDAVQCRSRARMPASARHLHGSARVACGCLTTLVPPLV